jgi:hypothetical protein
MNQLYCNNCNWKKIVDGKIDLVEVKTAPIPGGYPTLEDGKIIEPKQKKQLKKYKCPKCGFLVKVKKIDNPQKDIDEKNETEERIKRRMERDKKEREKLLDRQKEKQDWLIGHKERFK